MAVRWLMILPCITAGLLAADDRGLPPRADGADYPAHNTAGGVTLAATAISPEEAAKIFSPTLPHKGYMVLEVAIYPEPGREAEVKVRDFVLNPGDGTTVRPVSAAALGATLWPKADPKPPHDPKMPQVHTAATIGYETGTYGGQRRTSGVYTGAGVGVGNYPAAPDPAPTYSSTDPAALRHEVEVQGLPEGKTTRPVAGYLYFPYRPKAKQTSYNLTFYAPDGEVGVTVPVPKKK